MCLVVESIGGYFYMFGLYSVSMGQRFGLPQQQLQLVGSAANIGGTLGIPAGLLYDRAGPRPTLIIAGALNVCGWGGLWYAWHSGASTPVWLLVLYTMCPGLCAVCCVLCALCCLLYAVCCMLCAICCVLYLVCRVLCAVCCCAVLCVYPQ